MRGARVIGYYPRFPGAIPERGAGCPRVTQPFATLCTPEGALTVRLACVRRAASVHPEPGSNSPFECPAGAGRLVEAVRRLRLTPSARIPKETRRGTPGVAPLVRLNSQLSSRPLGRSIRFSGFAAPHGALPRGAREDYTHAGAGPQGTVDPFTSPPQFAAHIGGHDLSHRW